ncbi:MAG: sialate O-acetylesterase [Planctomycetota bacterium]
MHQLRVASTSLASAVRSLAALAVLFGSPYALARAQMPKADVVDVQAIGEGLCVSNFFQSNMVLQRDKPIAIWGWAAANEAVSVSLGGSREAAIADPERRWRVTLPPMPASATPQRMTIEGASATLTLDNILVGDVWVLGGQSNMEFELAKVENGALEIASANYPGIRILTVPYGVGPEPIRGFARLHEWSDWFGRHFRKGDWDVCTPEVARELSAIGFVFARRVHMASGVPIGVIDASRGGTSVETWTPLGVLRQMEAPVVQAMLAGWDQRVKDWVPPAEAQPGPSADANFPGNSFAGMLGPLLGLQVKGVIFHQGYNNALDGTRGVRLYEAVFPRMIESWRRAFGDPTLPFGVLSLCTDGDPQTRDNALERMLNAGIHIRAAQYQAFLALREQGDENIGFASTFDLRRRWYHPQVKVPAGERIARWALATQYGFARELQWTPPRLLGIEVADGALVLRLDADVSDPEDGAIEGFLIAGEDRRFQLADVAYAQVGVDDRGQPRYDRKQLVLTSPLVPAPVHFRYAWARNPLANLQVTGNKDLPFATQRSDDWDMGTVPLGVLDSEIDGKLSRAQQSRVLTALRAEDVRRRAAEARAFLAQHPEAAESGSSRAKD